MVKKKKNITKRKEVSKEQIYSIGHGNGDSDEGLSLVGFKEIIVGERLVMEYGRKLMEWVEEDEKALKITKFFYKHGIDMVTVWQWCKRWPSFGRLYNVALGMIGDRREERGLIRELDTRIICQTMHIYDPAYRQGLEWMESIKKVTESNKQQIVIIDRFPSTDSVPQAGE